MNNRNLIKLRVVMALMVPPLTVWIAVRGLMRGCKLSVVVWRYILLDTKQNLALWFEGCRDLWRGDR